MDLFLSMTASPEKACRVTVLLCLTLLMAGCFEPDDTKRRKETPNPRSQVGEPLRTMVTVDGSHSVGRMPDLFRAGVFEVNEQGISRGGIRYLREKFFSELLPGMTTIFVPLGEGNSFDEYRRKVEREGILRPVLEEAKLVSAGGGKVLFNLEWMPLWLSREPADKKREYFRQPPKDYELWKDLVGYTVNYLHKNGAKDADYRIWEEVDLGISKELKFWHGSDEEFCKLYKYSVGAIKSVDADAGVTFGLQGYRSEILRSMVRCIRENRLPLTYVVFHPFGASPYPQDFGYDVKQIQDVLIKGGLDRNIPVHAGSWNSALGVSGTAYASGWPDDRSLERDTEYNAAYAVQTLFSQNEGGIKYQCFFCRVDPVHVKHLEAGSIHKDQQFYGDYGMFTRDLVAKPVYNAFRLLSILSGKQEKQPPVRLRTNFDDEHVTAISSLSKDGKTIRVLVSNFVASSDAMRKARDEHIRDRYVKEHYGADALKPFEACLGTENAPKKCIALLPQELQTPLACLEEGRGEKCLSLMPRHFRDFLQRRQEHAERELIHAKEVTLVFRNIPFQGRALLTTYTVDKDRSNACRYNKKTEGIPSKTECGVNGEIDRMVLRAKEEAVKRTLEIVTKRPSLERIKGEIVESLFWSGRYVTESGEILTTSPSIHGINNDQHVALEGSKQKRGIIIGEDRAYRDVITIQPHGVVLVEVSREGG